MCQQVVDYQKGSIKATHGSKGGNQQSSTKSTCAVDDTHVSNSYYAYLSSFLRPVRPLLVLATLPLLPTWFFLNRGYTQWFHWYVLYIAKRGLNNWAYVVLFCIKISYVSLRYPLTQYIIFFCHCMLNSGPLSFMQ